MVIVVMGVSGSGKTTVGRKLAQALDRPFFDADDFHSDLNKEKMRNGQPLTDGDRKPWLELLSGSITQWNKEAPLSVLACSALKQKYRSLLSDGGEVVWVYLAGTPDLIRERFTRRENHFASVAILEAQLADLEEPEEAMRVDIREEPDKIVAAVVQKLNLSKGL